MKAIFSECSYPFWVEIAGKLAAESGWQPCYWTGTPTLETLVKGRFPNMVFHSNLDAIRGIPANACASLKQPPLDQELLECLAYHESLTIKMMHKMDPGHSFSLQERTRLYHTYLRYWLAVLDHFQPEVFVTPSASHLVYDYVLYVLCQRRGVKTIMFERTSLPGLIFPISRFEQGSVMIAQAYQFKLGTGQKPSLSPATEQYLRKINGTYEEGIPNFLKRRLDQAKENRVHQRMKKLLNASRSLSLYRKYAKNIVSYFLVANTRGYLKKRTTSIEDSWMSRWQRFLQDREGRRKKQQLRMYYERLAQKVDTDQPFVYVALHYQPERTTSPLGGMFVDQFVMVDLISKCVPPTWFVYVKEHISQFQNYSRGHQTRDFSFYDDMISLPNVRLMPLDASPFDLIDKAKAVATITGTTGWEAVVRGRPALIFGHAWFKGCEGVFYTPTEQTCREVLTQIADGYRPDSQKVRLFIQTLEEVCVTGYNDKKVSADAGISETQNVEALVRAIQQFYPTL